MPAFVDANIIVHAYVNNPDKDNCRAILSDVFVTDQLCIIEACNVIHRLTNNKVYAFDCIKSIFKGPSLIVPINQFLVFESLKRFPNYNLSFYDLLHYVCALMNNCEKIISYDKAFDGLEIRRVEP